VGIPTRDRRFDVTLLINGLPLIHIELKNKQHSYMDGFWQIKKYIGEGKFTGIFSAVQMFVISNGVDTKYFSAASDTELNPKFISGWLDKDNNPVPDTRHRSHKGSLKDRKIRLCMAYHRLR
jgi:type I restriction enzyme R subunit